MSDILLNYINNDIHLSKIITNIESDFKSGVYFCELIEKAFKLKPLNYNKNPNNISEILQNFKIIKNNLRIIGISSNDSIIKEIIDGKNGAAAKIIYKIKIESNRKKISFDNILLKINKNSLRENIELKNNNMNKTSMENLLTPNNYIQKRKKNSNKDKIYNFRSLNKYVKSKPMFVNEEISKRQIEKIKFPKLKIEGDNINLNYNNTFRNFNKKESDILVKINEEEKHKEKDNFNNTNYYLSTGYTTKKEIKKAKSLYEYSNILKNMKQDILNKSKKAVEKINNENLIKYSSFFKNSLKIGLNVDEFAPNMKKNAIIYKNDFLFSPSQMKNHLKNIITKRNIDKKKLNLENKFFPSAGNSFLTEQKRLIEKSILNMANDEARLFQNRFKKNSSIYKRFEYTKKLDEENDSINRQIKKKEFEKTASNFSKEEIKQISIDEYINNILIEKKINKINNNEKENYNKMKQITNLIIDMAESYYKRQIKLNEDLIDIPEYREWNDLFIEGKSCLNIAIKKRKNQNNISSIEKTNTNNSSLTKIKGEKKEKMKKNENIISDELINMEYLDYLNLRGNWEINNFINKEFYGKQLNIVTILGNDIFKLINISDDLIQHLKQNIIAKKNINNNEFELTEEELNNISVPETNINNNLLGEIITLNYDNIINEYQKNKENIKMMNINNNDKKIKEEENKDFSFIPIKLCFIGHSFSGRKTQAKLLCEKYKNLKSYSINDITQFYLDEYKRLNIQKDQNIKNIKSQKKGAINENKMNEDLDKYKYAFDLIESNQNFDKNKIEALTQENISDDIKINLLIYQIKIDFPINEESKMNEKIKERIEKRQNLEEELKKLNEEQNKETNNELSLNKKESKKGINIQKKNNNPIEQNIKEELEKIKIESLEGFILCDYPNNYNQMMKLENMLTGYIQPIDKDIDIRDFQLYNLTNSIDKSFINITNINPDISYFFNNNNYINQKSFFNAYIFIDLSEEETIKRMNNRFQDPNTGIIYHTEYNPPNPNDKKLNERLIELKEPNDEKIKELISQFYSEFPKILYIMNIFNNYYKIEEIDKNEIFTKIENYILLELKKYEEGENNDVIGTLVGELNKEDDEKIEVARYLKRLKEVKRVLSKEFSEEIIKYWADIQDKYKQQIKHFIKNYIENKIKILEQMNYYQEEFIEFLNNSSKKYKLVDIFYKKYNLILEKFPNLKNHHLIKEEFENNMLELSGNLWKLIQERKLVSISELKKIKNQNYIEQNLELFGNYIINLIILETKLYYNKINIIKKFYYEFERPRLSEKFPYEFTFKEESLLEDINNYQVFIPFDKNKTNDLNKEDIINNQEKLLSPKLNKVYLNCFKLFFIYEQEMTSLKNKLNEEYNNNMEQNQISLTRSKRKLKSYKKKTLRESQNQETNKIINEEEELKIALKNEKIKYKIRILFLKNFAEKKLEEIYNIGQKTFKDLDQFIIDSVNSQNSAMNELILKIKKHVNEGYYKLKVKDIELDIFDIYEKSNLNFEQFNLDFLSSISEEEKKINYKELYSIYLELKKYEIQDNYVYLNHFFDITFRKYLFNQKSSAFMKYMFKISFYYIYNLINKFAIKKTKRLSLIKLNEIFTIFGLLNKIPPKKDQLNNMIMKIGDKLKYKIFLTKKDYFEIKLWFEKEDKKIENKKGNKSLRSPSISEINLNNKLKDISSKEKKNKIRGSRVYPKLKFNMLNNSKENNMKEISEEEQLKEYLFNINKNKEELIDFINFIKIISIKKNSEKKKKKINLSDIKSNLDKDEILSMNSIVESFDKTQISETSNKFLKEINLKNSGINNSNNNISKGIKFDKNKISKNNNKIIEVNNNINDTSDEKININFPEYTYFDYLIKL